MSIDTPERERERETEKPRSVTFFRVTCRDIGVSKKHKKYIQNRPFWHFCPKMSKTFHPIRSDFYIHQKRPKLKFVKLLISNILIPFL